MRKILLSLLVSVSLVAAPAVCQAATKSSKRANDEQQVLVLLNQIRQQPGLSSFIMSTPLRNAARGHSADMLENGYFEHNSPNEAWDTRITRYLKSPLLGENIAWGQGSYGTAEGLVSQWMRSPTHRAIILTPGLHRIGVGVATGTFSGTPGSVMATTDFAV